MAMALGKKRCLGSQSHKLDKLLKEVLGSKPERDLPAGHMQRASEKHHRDLQLAVVELRPTPRPQRTIENRKMPSSGFI